MLIDILTLFYLLGNQCTSFNCVQAISLGFHTELIFRSGSGGEVHLGAPLFCEPVLLGVAGAHFSRQHSFLWVENH